MLAKHTLCAELDLSTHGSLIWCSHSQASEKEHAHDLNLLSQRCLQFVQQRHWHDQDDKIGEHIQGSDDRPSETRVGAVMWNTDFPIRIDGYALEYRSEYLSDTVAGDKNGNDPRGNSEAPAHKEHAIIEIQKRALY